MSQAVEAIIRGGRIEPVKSICMEEKRYPATVERLSSF